MDLRGVIGWLLLAVVTAHAQTPVRGTWETFTDLTSTRGIAVVAGSVFVATGGGLFWVDLQTGALVSKTNADGLTSNDLTAVAIDSRHNIWMGAADGALDILRPGESPESLSDIRDSNRLLKSIQRFVSRGDTLFIVSQFGVSVYRIDRDEFADTYGSFGYATQPICWDVAIARDTVWVATDQGIAAAPVNSANLSSPTSWTRLGTADGLPSVTVRSLLSVGDTLMVGTVAGTVIRVNGSFVQHPSLGTLSAVRLIRSGGVIGVLTIESGQSVASTFSSVLSSRTIVGPAVAGIAADIGLSTESGDLWMGFPGLGAGRFVSGAWSWTAPNGPVSNLFMSVSVDAEGTVWNGTGFNGGGKGFSRFRRSEAPGARWRSFTVAKDPGLLTDDYYKVSPIADGSVWVSSWGKGVVRVVRDTVRRRIDNASIPPLAGSILGNPTFVVVGSVAQDNQGRTWFVNRTAIDKYYLARLDNDTTFTKYRHETLPGVYTSMVIDRNGTKWLANSEPTSKNAFGLTYFNESLQIPGTSTDGGWGTFSESDGLADNTVMSLVVDLEGDVWVGTDLGVTIFNEPSNPRIRRSSSFPLREQSIQSIAVDGVNNKWVGTKEGVFVVSPDGAQLVAQYTVANTGGNLVSNDVRSVAIDQFRGIVYLGTEQGLSALAIDPVQTERRFSTLALGPNPFQIPGSEPLTIRNLVPRSRIKILGITGVVVSEFDAQGGGRAFWDGRDHQGRFVGSGTYFVVAYNENGEQLTTGKVAVVRR